MKPALTQQALHSNAATASKSRNRDQDMHPAPINAGPTARKPYKNRTPSTALFGKRSIRAYPRAAGEARRGNRVNSAGPSARPVAKKMLSLRNAPAAPT